MQHTSIPGFPGTRLNVRAGDVCRVLEEGGFGNDYCISPMVTQFGRVQWEGDICELPGVGLVCSGNLNPEPGSWRRHMLNPKLWERTAARALLRSVLNPNSYDDLGELLDRYPGHVVELSALEVCYGTCENRNAIVWEVRAY